MPPYSTADKKFRTNDPDSIHGSSRKVSSTNSRCFVRRACIPLLSSAFLVSIYHPSHIAHTTIAVSNLGLEGLFWTQVLATLFTSCGVILESWPHYSLLAVSSWNHYKVRIVSCIADLLGLAFLELFVQISTLPILQEFCLLLASMRAALLHRVPVPGYLSLMDSCA